MPQGKQESAAADKQQTNALEAEECVTAWKPLKVKNDFFKTSLHAHCILW